MNTRRYMLEYKTKTTRGKEGVKTQEMRIPNIQITSDCHHHKITEDSEGIQRKEKRDWIP